jgi:hypothetical protein
VTSLSTMKKSTGTLNGGTGYGTSGP